MGRLQFVFGLPWFLLGVQVLLDSNMLIWVTRIARVGCHTNPIKNGFVFWWNIGLRVYVCMHPHKHIYIFLFSYVFKTLSNVSCLF